MFNRKNRMAALMSMAKTSTLSQEDNADAPQPATEPAQKDVVEAPLTNDKGLETEKSTDGSGTTMAPGQDDDETQRTDVGSGAKELAPEAEIKNPKAPQADFDVKAPVLDPAADPNNPMGDDTKPQVAEPAANVGAADKSETQTENTEGGEKVGEDANKPKNAEGTTSGKPAMEGEKEGKVTEESEAGEIAAAAIAAYEQGVERGQAAAGGVPSEAPAEQQTPEQAAEQAAATVAQAAADAAQASAADIAAGGTGEVGVGEPAGVDGAAIDAAVAGAAEGAAEGAIDDTGIPADVGAAEGGDTTPAAEAALDDAAAGGVEPDSDPADGSNEGVSGDDATTAGEGEGSAEGEPSTEEGEPSQTPETEGEPSSDIETEEAKKKADAEEEALDDLDDLEEDEEIAMESYSVAGDMLQGILNFAQESYQSEVGGVTPGEARALAIALSAAQRIAGVQATQGLSLEAIDYRMPADVSDDLVYSTEELLEQVSENLQLSQESLLDIFRSRNTIFKNFCNEAAERISKLKSKLKGATGSVSVDTAFSHGIVDGLQKYEDGVKSSLETIGKNNAAIKNLRSQIDKMRTGDLDYKIVVSKLGEITPNAPTFAAGSLVTFKGSKVVSFNDEDYIEYDLVKDKDSARSVEIDLADAPKILAKLESSLSMLRGMNKDFTESEASLNKIESGTRRTGKQMLADSAVGGVVGGTTGAMSVGLFSIAATIPIALATIGGIVAWGYYLQKVRQDHKFGSNKTANTTMHQFGEFTQLVRYLQDGLRENIDQTLKALEKHK